MYAHLICTVICFYESLRPTYKLNIVQFNATVLAKLYHKENRKEYLR